MREYNRIRKKVRKKTTDGLHTLGSSDVERSHVRAIYNHANYESVRRAVPQRSNFLPIEERHIR